MVNPSGVDVVAVAVGALRPLRARVLRPGYDADAVVFPGDEADGAATSPHACPAASR